MQNEIDQWWSNWRDADFTWEGLRRHDWEGWFVANDTGEIFDHPGDGRRQASLQDYWRDQAAHLQMSPGGDYAYTLLHLPYFWRDGSPTRKAEIESASRETIDRALAKRAESSAHTPVQTRDVSGIWRQHAAGPDHRMQMQGTVLGDAARSIFQATHAFHLSAARSCWRYAQFHDRTFASGADFSDALILGRADFRKCAFEGESDFSDTIFVREAEFGGCQFGDYADLSGARFESVADFSVSVFKGDAEFRWSRTKRSLFFQRARFERQGLFQSARLPEDTTFENCQFVEVERAAWMARTIFVLAVVVAGLVFLLLPGVLNAIWAALALIALYAWSIIGGSLAWARAAKKPISDIERRSDYQLRSFLALQSRCNETGNRREAARFAGLSQTVRRLRMGGYGAAAATASRQGRLAVLGQFAPASASAGFERFLSKPAERLVSCLYELISRYGESMLRPITALLVSIAAFGALYFAMVRDNPTEPIAADIVDATSYSLRRAIPLGPPLPQPTRGCSFEQRLVDRACANTNADLDEEAPLNVPAARAREATALANRRLTLQIAAIAQSAAAVICLFLVGLAVRRRFEIG